MKEKMLNDKLVRWFLRQTPNSGLNIIPEVPITLGTDIGYVRNENQDRVAAMRVNSSPSVSHPFLVIGLADGMGGMIDGAECAARTLASFFNSMIRFRFNPAEERLFLAASEANKIVNDYAHGKGGATLSALLIDTDLQIYTLNVGDSRIYALENDSKGKALRLTVDDSLEEAVGGHGKELLQFIGMGDGIIPHVSKPLENLNRIVLTSDGVHFIGHEQLSDVFLYSENHNQVVDRLITLAQWRGAPDNASAAALFLEPLGKMLSQPEESGVEIWDPFGSIHVMWIKQDQIEQNNTKSTTAEIPTKTEQEVIEKSKASSNNTPESKTRKTKNTKRSKITKSEKSPNPSTPGPQLTIEIESFEIQIDNKNGGNDENSK